MEVQSMIVFTSRKSAVNEIVRALRRMGHATEGIMSDRTQEEREAAMQGFRNKQYKILVATDILSRGIDVDNISHIVNFDVPHDAEDYIHRIGRTARASTTGTAITFINEKEQYRVNQIERLIEKELPKYPLPPELGPVPEYTPGAKRSSTGQSRDKKRPFNKKRSSSRPRPAGQAGKENSRPQVPPAQNES
jgi:ATP-dependent RNA helicase RhlE